MYVAAPSGHRMDNPPTITGDSIQTVLDYLVETGILSPSELEITATLAIQLRVTPVLGERI